MTAGGDMQERAGMTQQETSEFVTSLRETFSAVQAWPSPTCTPQSMQAFATCGAFTSP